MIWTPAALAGMMLAAGWAPDDAVTAVAIVLATSRGDDGWRDVGTSSLPVDRRGLFGLDVTCWAEVDPALWEDPANNVAGARELWRAAGDTFSWAPAWCAGLDAGTVAAARAAVDAPTDGMTFREAQRAALVHELARGAGVTVDRAPELAAAFTMRHDALRRGDRR